MPLHRRTRCLMAYKQRRIAAEHMSPARSDQPTPSILCYGSSTRVQRRLRSIASALSIASLSGQGAVTSQYSESTRLHSGLPRKNEPQQQTLVAACTPCSAAQTRPNVENNSTSRNRRPCRAVGNEAPAVPPPHQPSALPISLSPACMPAPKPPVGASVNALPIGHGAAAPPPRDALPPARPALSCARERMLARTAARAARRAATCTARRTCAGWKRAATPAH